MFRHTARALLLLFVGLMLAPMMQPLLASAQAPHEACMRMEHACHHQPDDATSVRSNGRCEHDCCRGLTLRASAAIPLQVTIEARPAVLAPVVAHVQSSYRFQQNVSRPARAPPVVLA